MTQYRPELDGLRALAVLAVMFFHAGYSFFPGGFVGVDVFLVLSGYLIATLIMSEQAAGTFSLAGFFERRLRRLLPALFLVMACSLVPAFLLLRPSALRDFSQSLMAIATFAGNFLFWHESGYFAQATALKPLQHTWSLALEEQFYLVFPLVLMALPRKPGHSPVLGLILFALCSFSIACWWAITIPDAAFYLLPARAWEFLLGALVACRMYKPGSLQEFQSGRSASNQIGSLAGLGLILYAVLFFDRAMALPAVLVVLPALGTVCILVFTAPGTWVRQILTSPLLVKVGLLSYSAYLWHQVLFAFARHAGPAWTGTGMMALLCLLTLVLAHCSWRYVEQPCRQLRKGSRGQVYALAFAGSVLFVVIGTLGQLSHGFLWLKANAAQYRVLQTATASPISRDCHVDGPNHRPVAEACVYPAAVPTWAVFGDSHAVELAYALSEVLGQQGQAVQQFSISACEPGFGLPADAAALCSTWTRDAAAYIAGTAQLEHVVISYRLNARLFGMPGDGYPALPDSISASYRDALWARYLELLQYFVAAGKQVTVVLQAPELPDHIENLILDSLDSPEAIAGVSRAWWDARSAFVSSRLAQFPAGITVIDPAAGFCDAEACAAVSNGEALYYDDHHLSVAGARRVASSIMAASQP